ncbi:hypothetical protein PS3A_40530 [Pseudomonas sp. 3A(2025)]
MCGCARSGQKEPDRAEALPHSATISCVRQLCADAGGVAAKRIRVAVVRGFADQDDRYPADPKVSCAQLP